MANQYLEMIKDYFENRPVVKKLMSYLKDGSCIYFTIKGFDGEYYFIKEKKQGFVREGKPPIEPDVELFFTPKAIEKLVNFESDSVPEVGVLFLELLASKDPEVDIGLVQINSSVMTFMRKGYFKALLAGGAPVMGFLAKKGFGNLGAIKRGIEKRRKKK